MYPFFPKAHCYSVCLSVFFSSLGRHVNPKQHFWICTIWGFLLRVLNRRVLLQVTLHCIRVRTGWELKTCKLFGPCLCHNAALRRSSELSFFFFQSCRRSHHDKRKKSTWVMPNWATAQYRKKTPNFTIRFNNHCRYFFNFPFTKGSPGKM